MDDTEDLTPDQLAEVKSEQESRTNAQLLTLIGDLPEADVKPPENVLFVCKLNPVTTSEDLEIIFSRFGEILSCEVIRDKKTDVSLQYAFIEFKNEKDCENAFFKMDKVVIDDRRIHVDFSQSVAKEWHLTKKSQINSKFNYDDKSGRGRNNTKYGVNDLSKSSDDYGNSRFLKSSAHKKHENFNISYKKKVEHHGGSKEIGNHFDVVLSDSNSDGDDCTFKHAKRKHDGIF